MENEKKELNLEEMMNVVGGYQDGVYNFKQDTFQDQILNIRKLAR